MTHPCQAHFAHIRNMDKQGHLCRGCFQGHGSVIWSKEEYEMGKRVFLGVGHGGTDPGAVKFVREADANLVMALAAKEYLEARGVIVGISRIDNADDPLTEEIKEANAFGPDLAVDVHNNAGGGDGWEALIQTNGYAAESKAAAQAIEKEVKALGQQSRGLKTRLNSAGTDYFGFLRQIKAPAIIAEGFFVDNQTDAAGFDTRAEQQAMGCAYARGILAYFSIDDSNGATQYPVVVKVTASVLHIRKGPGTSYAVVGTIEDQGVYTIMEERGGWGRLKSGAGWISMAYTKKM